MGSELQFCWLLNQQSAQLARPLCAPPRGAGGRCLWTLATCRGAYKNPGLSLLACYFVFWTVLGCQLALTSMPIPSPKDKLHLDSSLAVEPEVCDDSGCIPCVNDQWPRPLV